MWTAEQEAQLQYLNTVLSGVQSAPVAPPAPQPSLWNRAGHQAANLPSSIGQGFVNSLTGVSNALQTDEEQVTPYQVPRPYDIPQAQTTGQRLVDTGANLTSGLAQFAITAAALGPLGRLAGLQGAGARVATDAAVGAIQGIGTSPQESGISAAQFGGMGAVNAIPLPWYVRGAMNAALGAGGQVARGQPLNTLDSATQMAVPFIGTAAHAYFAGRGTPEVQTAPEVQQPMFAPPTVPQGQGVPIETPSIPDFSHLAPPEPAPRGPTVFSGPITSERAASGEGPLPILSPDTAPPTVPQGQGVSIGQPEIPDYSHLMPAPPEPKPPVRFSGPITQEPASIFGKSPAESIASNLGVTYNGFGENLHAFTDPQTGSTFHVQSDLLTPELVAGKLQAIRAPFEQPGNILFGSSTDADIDAAIEAAKEPIPQASAPEPLQTFASTVNDLAKSAPFEDRFSGSPKVYIDRIWNKLPPGLADSREDFKQKLFQANQKGLIQLSRLDLVGAEPRKDLIDQSEIKDRIGEYHLVNEPQAPRPILRPYSDPAKAQALLNEARAQRVPDNQAESLLQDRVAEAQATQEVPTSLQKLAAMGRVSTEDLTTELGHYDDGERSAIQGALGSTDSEPETLAADLKEKFGPKGGQRGSSYESNPSKGRSDEIDLMRADPTEPETGPKAMRRLTGEAGFLDIRSPALQYLAGTAAGALLKPILNRNRDHTVGEDMAEGAILGAGSVALARSVGGLLRASKTSGGIKPILSDAKADAKETAQRIFTAEGANKASAEQIRQQPSGTGFITAAVRRGLGLDITPDIRMAMERGLGLQAHLTDEAKQAQGRFLALGRPATPDETAAAEKFTKSKGQQADIDALDKTPGVAPEFRDMLKVMKQAQIEGQTVTAKASLPPRASLIEATMGDYQSRSYKFFQDPLGWAKDKKAGKLDAALDGVVSDLAAQSEFKDFAPEVIRMQVQDYLEKAKQGQPVDSSGSKINASLFMKKHDLTPDQWRLMENLRSDPRLATTDRDIIKGMVTDGAIDGPGRQALKQIAGSGQLDDATNETLKTISDTETVSKNWRDLFGEYTDPVQRQAATVQKLLQSVHTAETISQLNDMRLPDGRKLAYSAKEISSELKAAQARGDTKTESTLLNNYFKLDENTSYGKLSGKFIERGGMEALNAFTAGTDNAMTPWWTKIQNLLKLNSTVLNPATHAHWWMQMPMMMAMARVYNPAVWDRAARIVMGDSEPEMNQEMKRLGIIGADFSSRELKSSTKKFSPEPLPETTIEKMKASKDQFIAWMGKAYGKPDNIIRAAAYLNKKAGLLEEADAAAQGRGLTGAPAKAFAEQYAQDGAAKFTNRYTINYGTVPPVGQALRNIPFFNPFLSYTSEMLRITKNFGEDIATGPASDKMHAAANLGLMAGVPLALSLGSKQANLSQDDQDLWDRVQRLEPTYLRHSIKLVLGRDSRGAFNYVDMAPILPSGDFYSLAKEAAGGDWKTFFAEQPLVGLDSSPLASLAMDISRGENHITGQKIYTPGDYAALLWNAGTPPVLGTQLARDVRATTANADGGLGIENPRTGRTDTPSTSLLQHVGVRIASETFPAMLGNLQSDRQDKLDAAKSQMLQILRTNAGPDAKQDAVNVFRNRAQEVNQSFLQKVKGS